MIVRDIYFLGQKEKHHFLLNNMKKENKYTLEQEFQLGDFIHNCDNALVILSITEKNDKDNVVVSVKFDSPEKIIGILIEVMNDNQGIAELLEVAVMHHKINSISKKFGQ